MPYTTEYEPDDGTGDVYTINYDIDVEEEPSGPYHSGHSYAVPEILSIYRDMKMENPVPGLMGSDIKAWARKGEVWTTEEVDLEGQWYQDNKEAIESKLQRDIDDMGGSEDY